MTNFTIRTAEPKDLDTLVDFNARLALETENLRLSKDVLSRSMQAILQDPRKGVYLFACEGDKIVGQLMYVYEWSTWHNANFMWLTDLYVLPQYRRHGVFKLLSDYAMNLYRTREEVVGLRFYVDKHNTSVVPLYKKIGWKESNYELWETVKDGVPVSGK